VHSAAYHRCKSWGYRDHQRYCRHY
jgi:hypothetical protein